MGKFLIFDHPKFAGFMRWALLALELNCLLWFLLRFSGAEQLNSLTAFLYQLTGFLLYPFERPVPVVPGLAFDHNGTRSFEWATLIAMLVYGILFYLARLLLYTILLSQEELMQQAQRRETKPGREAEYSDDAPESKPLQKTLLQKRGNPLPQAPPRPYIEHEPACIVRREIHTDSGVSSLIDTGEREASLLQQRFGNHTLIRQIGQGGYSNVYLGVHSYLNIEVALKLLDLCRASDDEKKRFQFEARIHAQLRHRHIVRVLDFGWGKSTPFMVMEYAPAGTLQKFFPPQVPLPLRAIMPAVLQIASALKYVHDHGLIHCDVKPENMLLGPGKEVWLADFGIACPITAAGSTQFSANKLVGTPLYLAPEQISGNPLPASDQYALAVMVYIWLCGQVPFRGTSLQVCLQHLSASPPRLREHVPSISPAVEQIVLKALAKDPKQRFAQVQEFAHALRQASQVESVTMLTRTMTQAP